MQSVAKWYEGKAADFQATQPALWIYDLRLLEPDGNPPALVWRLEVTIRMQPRRSGELILVDAHRGNISPHFNQDDTAWASNQSIHLDEETPTVEEPTATDAPTEITPVPTDLPTETTVRPAETATEVPITATSAPTETAAPTELPTTTPSTGAVQTQSGTPRYVATTGTD